MALKAVVVGIDRHLDHAILELSARGATPWLRGCCFPTSLRGQAHEMSGPRMPTTRPSAPGDPQGARQRPGEGTWLV